MPDMQKTETDSLFYLGSDQGLLAGLRERLEPQRAEVRGFRTLTGMMLAAVNRRVRVLVLEPSLLASERTPESILDRLADANGTRPLLVCLAAAGESAARLLQEYPEARAAFQPPFDAAAVVARIEELLQGDATAVRRVLIVDADHGEGAEIAAILRRVGAAAELVADPREVRTALERIKPDLAILDLNLSRGRARTVTETIRDHGSFRDLPIVFLSAEQAPDQRGDVLSLGDEDFLARPIVPEQLLTAVQRRLRQVRASGDACSTAHSRGSDDQGTALLSRTHLFQRLDRTIAEHPIPAPGQAVLLIQIDRQRPSLAPFGEAGLDAVRSVVVDLMRRLAGSAYRGACASEAGFILWVRCRDDRGVATLAEEIRAAAEAQEVPMGLSAARFTLSVGVGGFLPPADDALTLVSRAQSACEQARDLGGNRVAIHEPLTDSTDGGGDGALHRLIRQALDGTGFQLVYQPLLSLRRKHQERYEVLLRLRTPQGDIIPPLTFLPVASRHGLLPAIDRWVLSGALGVLRGERDAGHRTRLMIFQSAASLATAGWLPWVRDEILRLDLIRQRPVLEFNALDILASEEDALLRQIDPGVDHGIRVEGHALDALAQQPVGEVLVVGWALAADADVLALARQAAMAMESIFLTAGSRSSKSAATRPESRSRPRVSWVMSLEPIEKPSKYSRNSSASTRWRGSRTS
jgi:PleD family two-component response regulator